MVDIASSCIMVVRCGGRVVVGGVVEIKKQVGEPNIWLMIKLYSAHKSRSISHFYLWEKI